MFTLEGRHISASAKDHKRDRGFMGVSMAYTDIDIGPDRLGEDI